MGLPRGYYYCQTNCPIDLKISDVFIVGFEVDTYPIRYNVHSTKEVEYLAKITNIEHTDVITYTYKVIEEIE